MVFYKDNHRKDTTPCEIGDKVECIVENERYVLPEFKKIDIGDWDRYGDGFGSQHHFSVLEVVERRGFPKES